MDNIHAGWLTKSPRQRKTSTLWKLFRSRWRRRYFVLYAPPASTMLPGMCSAVLDYYDNERLLFKKGTIDLTNCIDVHVHQESEFCQHVFSLRTKHRGCDRTYYLVSDTESDMKHWVECLRAVLFLDGSFEEGREMFVRGPNGNSSVSSDPGERYIRVPEHNMSTSLSCDMSVTSISSPIQPSIAVGRCPSMFPVRSETPSMRETSNDDGEQYILLEDCYSGSRANTLPVYSASHTDWSVSLNQMTRNACSSSLAAVDANSGDKVEYCNECELGEHDSVFSDDATHIDANGNGCDKACIVDDDDDETNECYSHYQYPRICYSMRRSILSELSEPGPVSDSNVNCSAAVELSDKCECEHFFAAKRHGICFESLRTSSQLWQIFNDCNWLSLDSAGRECIVPANSCSGRFKSCQNVSSNSKFCESDDDDEDCDTAHDYVNIEAVFAHMQHQHRFPGHLLPSSATFPLCNKHPKFH